MKNIRILWNIIRVIAWAQGRYKPPFGSVGHAIQSGRITEDEAINYLDRRSTS